MLLLSRFIISGHSMEPNILQGQTVLASSIPYLFSKPKVNDIVAFKEKNTGKIFMKRLVKVDGDKYLVKGDNEKDSFDSTKFGWINKKEIVGKVVYKFLIPN